MAEQEREALAEALWAADRDASVHGRGYGPTWAKEPCRPHYRRMAGHFIARDAALIAEAKAAERETIVTCACGHAPHLHDPEAVPALCMSCGHAKDCGDAAHWRQTEAKLRDFHIEAIAEAAEAVDAALTEAAARISAWILRNGLDGATRGAVAAREVVEGLRDERRGT